MPKEKKEKKSPEEVKANKRKKFVKNAKSRTKTAVKFIRLVGDLSSKRAYEYSEKDVKTIFNALESELGKAKKRFEVGRESRDFELELDEDLN